MKQRCYRDPAEMYVARIRNAEKRDYAARYLMYLLAGEVGASPDSSGLSYMAAQAVRIQLLHALYLKRMTERAS